MIKITKIRTGAQKTVKRTESAVSPPVPDELRGTEARKAGLKIKKLATPDALHDFSKAEIERVPLRAQIKNERQLPLPTHRINRFKQ